MRKHLGLLTASRIARITGGIAILLFSLVVTGFTGDATSPAAIAGGTTFTYQGRLTGEGSSPVNGLCNFQFGLWDAPVTGTLVAGPVVLPDVAVSDGRFTVALTETAVRLSWPTD